MGRTAIVTGGTGGLGAAVTGRLLEDGWRVVVPWFAERELERVEAHDRLDLVQADLTDPASAASVAEAAGADLGALVNLVGGFARANASTRPRSTTSSGSCASTSARPT